MPHQPSNNSIWEDELGDEEPWVYNVGVLIWPPQNLLKFSPFERDMLPNERLNAQARITILLGVVIFLLANHGGDPNAKIFLFWTILHLITQGSSYLRTEDGKRIEEIKRLEAQREKELVDIATRYANSQHVMQHQQGTVATQPTRTMYEQWMAMGYGNDAAYTKSGFVF